MPTELNISLSSNSESPTIKFVLTDELAAALSGSTTDMPSNIKYVATGAQGDTGQTGASGVDGTAVISAGSVTESKLANNSVTSNKISSSAVTSSKLSNNSVTTSKIANNAITADKIAPGVVTSELLADGIISSNKIGEGSIKTNKLENGSVTTAKIAANTITKAKIAARTLSGAEIEENVVLDGAKVNGSFQLLGSSPAFLKGPNHDVLNIQSERDLVFRVDSNNDQTSSFLYKNGAGTTVFSIDESGNVTTVGTVAGRDLAADGAKLDGISDSEIIDWSVTQTLNIHSNNYINTIYTHPSSHAISFITGLQAALDAKVDDSEVLTSVPSGALFTDTNTQLPLIDSDTMTGALSTNVASAESVKAYVDSKTHLELGTTSTTALAGDTTTISTTQANAITANTAKVSFPGLGTSSTTALAGDTALLQLGTSSTTALAGDTTTISGSQASAITANTAKTGITSQQATDITTNNAKVGITTSQANAITANTAKTGITTSQANAITANTAKPDLTVDGAGTINANNVPTLNQSTTGNAATATLATNAQGIASATDGDVTITSDGHVVVKLDADNDESNQRFKITDNSDAVVFHVQENGTVMLAGHVITNSGSDNDLTLETDGSLIFTIDRDNDETSQKFSFVNFNAEVASIDESGNLQIDSDLTVDGNNITNNASAANFNISSSRVLELQHAGSFDIQMGNATNPDVLKVEGDAQEVTINGTLELGHASDTTIARSAAGKVSIEGNEIQTKNVHHHFIHAGWFMSYPYARYIPLNGSINEQNTATSSPEYVNYTFPYDGYVKKMILRSETDMGSTNLKLYKGASGATVTTVLGDVSATVGASAAVEFDFTSVSSAYSKGDTMAIKVTPTEDPDGGQNITIELVFDLTT